MNLIVTARNATYSLVAPVITSSQQEVVKYIAIVTMVIAHFGAVFFEGDMITYAIGRVTFPLFAFLMMYNYLHHTSSKYQYITRILIVAIIAQAPYQMLFHSEVINMVNIMFTLAAGLSITTAIDYILEEKNKLKKYFVAYMAAAFFIAVGTQVDYIHLGLILIVAYWAWLKFPSHTTLYIAIGATLVMNLPSGVWMMLSGLGAFAIIIFVLSINFETNRINKWIYYAFYPAHLMLIQLLKAWQ